MDDDQLQILASSLTDRALTRIVAELGPRAWPSRRENYLASAGVIAEEVFGDRWEYNLTMDIEGKPYIFVGAYHGRS